MGDTMRTVAAEPTPVMRQEAYPELLGIIPKTDVISYRERTIDSKPYWQDFVSPHYSFYPEFTDFMKHVDRNQENINKQISVFEDVFYRSRVFHAAPYVYVVGVGLVPAPTGIPSADGSTGKSFGWISAQLTALQGVPQGYLSFQAIFKALNAFEQEVGGTPFEGSGLPKGDSNPLNEKFCLITSGETWNNFVDDPWLKENRPLNMDVVTDTFKGDLWGRVRCKLERYPLRYKTDNNNTPSMPDPEIAELDSVRDDFGRTKPNPDYARPQNSPFEVAFLVGGNSADIIDPAPPPSEFVRSLDQGAAIKMNWNGKVWMNKDFLVPCKDANGNVTYDFNSWGRYLRLQATLQVGIRLLNAHNVLPIIFKRRVGVTTTTP